MTPKARDHSLDRRARSARVSPAFACAHPRRGRRKSRRPHGAVTARVRSLHSVAFTPCAAAPTTAHLRTTRPPCGLGGLFSANVWHTNRPRTPKANAPPSQPRAHRPQTTPSTPSPPNRPPAPQQPPNASNTPPRRPLTATTTRSHSITPPPDASHTPRRQDPHRGRVTPCAAPEPIQPPARTPSPTNRTRRRPQTPQRPSGRHAGLLRGRVGAFTPCDLCVCPGFPAAPVCWYDEHERPCRCGRGPANVWPVPTRGVRSPVFPRAPPVLRLSRHHRHLGVGEPVTLSLMKRRCSSAMKSSLERLIST